jgi:DNA invertase Pin-like site-specific DNA recombinase
MVQEKLRAVFYARVSTEEEKQLNALEKQVAECKDAVLQKGWKLVDQYVDEGKSGTQIKRRDEYRRLFEDLENDKFDIVVIKSQDRLQRNTLDWYIWIDRLTTHGKRLYMYLEDTFYSPDNALISGIKAILAEEYSRELSKKINNSYKRRIEAAKNGEKISIVNNSRSLGYDKVNGELVINEKEAEVVRMIFNMYASGEGLRAISNTLYDMGYRNRSGNEIDPTTISRMLSSEKYKGVYVINQRHYDFDTKKTVLNPKSEWVHIPGAVPAIVEPELWDRVQEIKGSKVQSIKNEKRGRNCGKSIFSGKIYCAKCGAKYWRSLENGYVKFKCSSYSKYGKIPGKGCDNKSFSENALYSILQSLSEQIVEVNTAEVRKSLLNWLESLRERLRASQGDDTIKEEIRKQTARKEKLTDAYMDGIISKEDYSKRYKELEKTLEDLKDKLLTLEVNEDLQSIEEVIQNIDKEMEEYLQTQSFNESRVEFLNQHLTKVTVNKDSFLLEFDLIGGAILTGKDFYLFVDNPRRYCKSILDFWI